MRWWTWLAFLERVGIVYSGSLGLYFKGRDHPAQNPVFFFLFLKICDCNAVCAPFVTQSKPILELFFIYASYVKVMKNMKLFFLNTPYFLFILCPAGSPHKPFECRAGVQADLVLLVDGSWSIGRTNFKKVREFLEGLVTPFHIGPYGVQIGKPGQASCSFSVCDNHLNSWTSDSWILISVCEVYIKFCHVWVSLDLLVNV